MRKWILLLVALAGGVSTGKAEAQVTTWDSVAEFLNICVSSSLRPCASVIVRTRATGAGTFVEVLVRNEQGSDEVESVDVTGGSFITAIGLTAPSLSSITGFAVGVDPHDPATIVGTDPGQWWVDSNNPIGGQVVFSTGVRGLEGGIRGCDPANGNPTDYFLTCGSGWVSFSFTTTTIFEASEAEIALKFVSMGPNDLSLECRTEDVGGDHACSTIPEPSTYALLLTGLVGVLGMGWLRRRKEEDTT